MHTHPSWFVGALEAARSGWLGRARDALAPVRLADVCAWIAPIAQDDAYAAQVAGRSYWHGNGFCKIVLGEHSGVKLRLHVWEPGRSAEENIHDHRWDFASVVLSGALVATTYRESPCGERYRAHGYEGGVAGAYTLAAQGEVALVEAGVLSLGAGSSYWMHHDELHAISRVSAAELTSTLVVTGPAHRASTRLITNRLGVVLEHPAEPLTVSELRRVVAELARTANPFSVAA